MIDHNSVEFELLGTVKRFCTEYYTDCSVIIHPSVYFRDATFANKPFDEDEAKRELGTNPSTRHICEVTPDYGVFRNEDLLGIRIKLGSTNGEELFLPPGSPQFESRLEATAPIPYVAWESLAPSVPGGKKMVVVLKDQAYPVAILDHKGTGDINSQSQRKKIAYQARRFGAQNVYMVTETKDSKSVNTEGDISTEIAADYENGSVWRLIDNRR